MPCLVRTSRRVDEQSGVDGRSPHEIAASGYRARESLGVIECVGVAVCPPAFDDGSDACVGAPVARSDGEYGVEEGGFDFVAPATRPIGPIRKEVLVDERFQTVNLGGHEAFGWLTR